VQTIRETKEAKTDIEDVAHGNRHPDSQNGYVNVEGEGNIIIVVAGDGDTISHHELDMEEDEQVEEEGNWFDAVVVCHESTDLMHKETLLEIFPGIPVFATSKASSAIRSWRHLDSVFEVPCSTADWRESSRDLLPEWIGISRVAYPGADLLNYHSAIMISFALSSAADNGVAEAVIYTPHGISIDSIGDLAPVATSNPTVQTLVLLHGLQDIKLGGTA
jgi:hypothetical protein